jgi:hypothetical protein
MHVFQIGNGWQFGPDGSSNSAPVFDIIGRIFETYLFSLTSVLIYAIIGLVILVYFRYTGRYGTASRKKFIFRAVSSLLVISALYPLLRAAVWIATGSEAGDSGYPTDRIFGIGFGDRIVGPDAGLGLQGLQQLLANVFHTYQYTISFLLITFIVFFTVTYAIFKWPLGDDLVARKQRYRRAVLGLVGSMSIVPVLQAISWIATGVADPDSPVSLVGPAADLPGETLFNAVGYHPIIQHLTATKDPFESILVGIHQVQLVTLAFVACVIFAVGIVIMAGFNRLSYFESDVGPQSVRGGLLVVGFVFAVPLLLSTSAWLATGAVGANVSGGQDLAGVPFSEQTTFNTCTTENWVARTGNVHPIAADNATGCNLRVNGAAERQFDLTTAPNGTGYAEIRTSDQVRIEIYDGNSLVVSERIDTTQRFTFEVSAETTVVIVGSQDEIRSVRVGVEVS